jgi:hypothetical protein
MAPSKPSSTANCVRARADDEQTLDELIANTLQAIPLLQRWGSDWAAIVRSFVGHGQVSEGYDAEIVGQAILGAIHQAASEGFRSGRTQEDVVRNLTQFLVRALRP